MYNIMNVLNPLNCPLKMVKMVNIICCYCLVTKSCLTRNPMDCSPPVSLSMEFPRQEYWTGLLFPSPGDLPDSGIELLSPSSLLYCRWDSLLLSSVQFSSVAQSCPTLCDPMNHSTPGLPVYHLLPELTQTCFH